jgi:hypothetical protein
MTATRPIKAATARAATGARLEFDTEMAPLLGAAAAEDDAAGAADDEAPAAAELLVVAAFPSAAFWKSVTAAAEGGLTTKTIPADYFPENKG